MKTKNDTKISTLILMIEILGYIALGVVEYISGYRGGLMHHLYYRKAIYLSGIYSESNMLMQLAVIAILSFILIALYRLKKKEITKIVPLLIKLVILVLIIMLPFLKDLNVYVYLVMYTQAITLINIIRIGILLASKG